MVFTWSARTCATALEQWGIMDDRHAVTTTAQEQWHEVRLLRGETNTTRMVRTAYRTAVRKQGKETNPMIPVMLASMFSFGLTSAIAIFLMGVGLLLAAALGIGLGGTV